MGKFTDDFYHQRGVSPIDDGTMLVKEHGTGRVRWMPGDPREAEIEREARSVLESWARRRHVRVERDPRTGIPGVEFETDELLMAFVVEATVMLLEHYEGKAQLDGYDVGYAECMSDNYEDDNESDSEGS